MLGSVLGTKIAIFIGGAALGGSLTYFSISKQASPVASTKLSPAGLGGFGGQGPLVRRQEDSGTAQEILKYGNPGPISDFREHVSYVMSYNRMLRNPNWVAEHLTKEKLKNNGGDRSDSNFHEDASIPEEFRALLKDYYRSGYDRGHMVPAADAKVSQEAMNETFLLSNMAPQVGRGFNRDYWAHFEEFIRRLTDSFEDVYCITGPLYLPQQDPTNKKWYTKYEVIGNPPNIAVPTHFYKVVLVKRKSESSVAIGGFVLPNAQIDNAKPLTDFSVPIEHIEKAAGLNFFDKEARMKAAPLCSKTRCQTVLSKFHKKQLELTNKPALPRK
ncbi:nuclease [Mycoemilia scoparia]|uniref:Endonuclease n=1 Tax=Mycoemilia scoparia TaxID=417184 RepID=A0A9W8DN23_9FUNG|nr:nuclease [Mycoemilia scoparia]